MKHTVKLILAAAALLSTATDSLANSAIYACGHIRRERAKAIPALKSSGYTTAIIFNVSVEKDGTLTTDYDWGNQRPAEAGGIICRDGEYVFGEYQPYFVEDIKSLLVPPTSIDRLEYCIGGWTNGSYGNIRTLVNQYGTDENSILYRNFKALKEAIPEVVAINNDQEQDYDVATATAFHKMLAEIGFKTTIAPYTQMSFWTQLVDNLNAEEQICELVYLQTYGGGAYNTPSSWKVFGNIPMYMGFDNESNSSLQSMINKFEGWKTEVDGGFIWNYNNENHNLNQWATAINRIFPPVKVDDPVVTVYGQTSFGGTGYSLPVGEFSQGEMSLYGVQGRELTSFELKEGYSITIYAGDSFTGNSQTFTESSSNVGLTWRSRTCSIKVEALSDAVHDISSSSTRTFEVFDVNGCKVAEGETSLSAVQYIASSSLPKGIYLVKSGDTTQKVAK